ncbi:hypothetical protein KI387_042592, partial [Taxus chinensis]
RREGGRSWGCEGSQGGGQICRCLEHIIKPEPPFTIEQHEANVPAYSSVWGEEAMTLVSCSSRAAYDVWKGSRYILQHESSEFGLPYVGMLPSSLTSFNRSVREAKGGLEARVWTVVPLAFLLQPIHGDVRPDVELCAR